MIIYGYGMKWDIHGNPVHTSFTNPHDRAKYSIVQGVLYWLRFTAPKRSGQIQPVTWCCEGHLCLHLPG